MSDALWIIVIAVLTGLVNAWLGVFLVLRRQAMLGDAISHSVLFGLVAAFLLSGSRETLPMFAGALAAGLLTAWLSSVLERRGGVSADASMGVVFTTLFALGVILISSQAGQIDLDQECVLYGEIAFAPLDVISMGGMDLGPRAFWSLLAVAAPTLALILIALPRLQALSFDARHAAALGLNIGLWHFLLMALTALSAVASFDAVGAILVVAMLVLPALSAWRMARGLGGMLVWASVYAVLASLSGYAFAVWLDVSISASIGVAGGILLLITLLFLGPQAMLRSPPRPADDAVASSLSDLSG
ncbi:MAG: metal ABC transporter permease [Halothiobacillaceae bacterium]|nr:MAG: metal ABC transporter permease [Halothiobacillaceae bacterium]